MQRFDTNMGVLAGVLLLLGPAGFSGCDAGSSDEAFEGATAAEGAVAGGAPALAFKAATAAAAAAAPNERPPVDEPTSKLP